MISTNESVMNYLREISRDLPLFCNGESPMAMPSNFRTVSRDDLLRGEALRKSFIACFRDVFGRGDIWGEGFICSQCGKVLPIEESSRKCSCGGKLVDFYSEEQLCDRLTNELEPPAFCTLMLSAPNSAEVAGFSMGFIGDVDRLSRYIASDKHVCGVENAVKNALGNCGRVLFFDETGIRRESRAGASSLVSLTRAAFEKGNQEQVVSSLTWTARKSPIYKICLALGFVDVLETDNGIVFLFLEDFIPALKVMQNKSSLQCAKVLVRLSRLCSP